MNNDVISNNNASATTCRIAPPVDERFDEEAFLRREMAEAKTALRRTVEVMKEHGTRELNPEQFIRRHPLAAGGAVGLGGLLLVRKLFRRRKPERRDERPNETPQKAGLLAIMIPAVVSIIQSVTAAKVAGAQAPPSSPQAWMARTLWGFARDRFRGRGSQETAAPPVPDRGVKAAASRTPAPEPMRDRRVKPR